MLQNSKPKATLSLSADVFIAQIHLNSYVLAGLKNLIVWFRPTEGHEMGIALAIMNGTVRDRRNKCGVGQCMHDKLTKFVGVSEMS